MNTRNYAANLDISCANIEGLAEFARHLSEILFVRRQWQHLNICEAYNIDSSLTKLANNKNGLFINRFNEGHYDFPSKHHYDYYGVRGYPLIDIFPDWKEKQRLIEDSGLELSLDVPCIVLSNIRVDVHRDMMIPEPEGYRSRQCGLNYLLFDNGNYQMGAWDNQEGQDSHKEYGDLKGMGYTIPKALLQYDCSSMNLVNTFVPHGSYIDPNIIESPKFSPRAIITFPLIGTYENAREKLSKYVKRDW